MYFNKKTFVKNYDYMKPSEKHSILIKKGGKVLKSIDPKRITNIVEEVGYWRKANAIHGWFVDNVQDGVDNCGEHYVSEEQIKELLGLVNKVIKASKLVKGNVHCGTESKDGRTMPIIKKGKYIKDASVAKELLPVRAGFFFGSYDEDTAYDEWYLDDIKKTKKILEKALLDKEGDYYYQSSW